MKTYTRGIDREYQRILLKDAKTSSGIDGEVSIDVNPHNIQQANDYLVKAMFEISDEALDNMPITEYAEKLQEAQKSERFFIDKDLVSKYSDAIARGGRITKEHRDYELCKLFHCSPAQLYEVEESILSLYREFRQQELELEDLRNKRLQQKKSLSMK